MGQQWCWYQGHQARDAGHMPEVPDASNAYDGRVAIYSSYGHNRPMDNPWLEPL